MNNKCVYVFLDHRKPGSYIYDDIFFDFEPIYVGKGNLNRPKNHKYRLNKNNRFYDKYKKILRETGEHPKYLLIKNNLTEIEANKLEIELIYKIKKIDDGGTLTNIGNGGEGQSIKLSNERKKDISKILKERYSKNAIIRKNNFIEKSNNFHNNKYDYSLIEYKNSQTDVEIICPIHGIFKQRPDSHLHSGCSKCAKKYKRTTDEIIEEFNFIHENRYDYSLTKFKKNREKIKIICPVHGVFEQLAETHFKCGCPRCFGTPKLNNEKFITKSKIKHGDRYDYSLVEYDGAFNKVKIICKEHGIFEQISKNHYLSGYGCPECGKKRGI